MDRSLGSEKKFIEQWLNHFNLIYSKDVQTKFNKNKLDFIISDFGLGILLPNWKKPLSVVLVNQAIDLVKYYQLQEIFIIADEVSMHAYNAIDRFNYPIQFLKSTELSTLAMKLVNVSKIGTLST